MNNLIIFIPKVRINLINEKTNPQNEEILEAFSYQEPLAPIIRVYDTVPKYYFNYDTWIKSINLACRNCTCSFKGVPWFIPKTKITKTVLKSTFTQLSEKTLHTLMQNIHDNNREKTVSVTLIEVEGVMCSAVCVVSCHKTQKYRK